MASRRAILLISQQLNPAVDNFLHALGALEGEPVPPINAKVVPITGNVWYARHLAVTIVDADIWDNEESTLLEVLSSARRWDHRGWRSASSSASGSLNTSSNTGRAGRCEEWSENDIQTIRAVQKLGETYKTDDEISESGKNSFPTEDITFNAKCISIRPPLPRLGIFSCMVELSGVCNPAGIHALRNQLCSCGNSRQLSKGVSTADSEAAVSRSL